MSLAGKLLYQLWHRPLGAVLHSYRHGGPVRQWHAAQGCKAMQAAAARLPPLPPRQSASTLTVHFLTGQRFAYQTAFCLFSLARHVPVYVRPELYDDGSLDDDSRHLITRICPDAIIHPQSESIARLESELPSKKFPVLRERWLHYPHIRKLMDVHVGHRGWHLVLDSDLLFWREPRLILDWSAAPTRPLFATDCTENYGYSRAALERLTKKPLPARLNVGLCGLKSEDIDWDYLEYCAGTLIREHGTSYYLEQGLCALLAARHPHPPLLAPFHDYITMPSDAEIAHPMATMHHYVDLSRNGYHLAAWKRILSDA